MLVLINWSSLLKEPVNTLNQNFWSIGENRVVKPTIRKDTKKPDRVERERLPNKHPNPIRAKISAAK